MQSIFKRMRDKIQDIKNGKKCNCHRPALLTFPDMEDNFEILETKEIKKVNNKIQFTKTEVKARCKICDSNWLVEITSDPDRRTRVWKKLK